MKKALLIFLFLLISASIFSQPVLIKKKNTPKDSVYFIQLDTVKIWTLNDSIRLWKSPNKQELWYKYTSANKWTITPKNEVWTVPEMGMRIWKDENTIKVWYNNTTREKAELTIVNDSIKIWQLNDSTVFFAINENNSVWKTYSPVMFWKKKSRFEMWNVNDTVGYCNINDTTKLRLIGDSCDLWRLNNTLDSWHISQNTRGWTLDASTEVWKVNKSVQLWKTSKSSFDWTRSKFPKKWRINDSTEVRKANETAKVWIINDSIQIWRMDKTTQIWSMTDSIRAWQIPKPPKVEIVPQDTIKKKKKKPDVPLVKIDNNTKVWHVDNKTHIWKLSGIPQVWTLNTTAELWSVNDSTHLWSIDENLKISILNDSVKVWDYIDSTKTWKVNKTIKESRLKDSLRIIKLHENLNLTIKPDEPQGKLWNVNHAIRIACMKTKKDSRILHINDSVLVWNVDDSTRFRIEPPDETTNLWKRDKSVKGLPINDSTTFWQINDFMRMFLIKDTVKFWQIETTTGNKMWKPMDNIVHKPINDSVTVYKISPQIEVWKINNKPAVWRLNKNTTIWDLNDTIKVWTITPRRKKKLPKKPKYWSFTGAGNINFSQAFYEHWSKGGESNIAISTILKMNANYAKDNVTWENEFEYNGGMMVQEKGETQKTLDKIMLNSKYGRRAFNFVFYSVFVNAESQLFNGLNKNDVLVSKLLSPLNITTGIGIDIRPNKWVSVVVSPITEKITYIYDTLNIDQTIHDVDSLRKSNSQPGAYINSKVKFDLTRNISVENKLSFFSNYVNNPENIDINWQVGIAMRINKYINTNISTHLIYDDDINIPVYEWKEDKKVKVGEGPRTQFREILSIGFSYKF